ncbi:hypothetical protein [Sporosarcina thermotolerans]
MELNPYNTESHLPTNGILYLFYDVVAQPWGFEEDEGCFGFYTLTGKKKS